MAVWRSAADIPSAAGSLQDPRHQLARSAKGSAGAADAGGGLDMGGGTTGAVDAGRDVGCMTWTGAVEDGLDVPSWIAPGVPGWTGNEPPLPNGKLGCAG